MTADIKKSMQFNDSVWLLLPQYSTTDRKYRFM